MSQPRVSVVSVFETVFHRQVWFYFHEFQVFFYPALMHDLVM